MNIEELLKENTGLLSRMKERDGNKKLDEICEKIFKESLDKKEKQCYNKGTG